MYQREHISERTLNFAKELTTTIEMGQSAMCTLSLGERQVCGETFLLGTQDAQE